MAPLPSSGPEHLRLKALREEGARHHLVVAGLAGQRGAPLSGQLHRSLAAKLGSGERISSAALTSYLAGLPHHPALVVPAGCEWLQAPLDTRFPPSRATVQAAMNVTCTESQRSWAETQPYKYTATEYETKTVTVPGRSREAIDKLEAKGGTCIECGLKLAFEKVDKTRSGDRENRVMLFTDAQPNVGATGEGEFTTLVSSYADRIGLTAFGVGIDFGAQLVNTISRVKGGNYFYLEDGEKIRTVFDEEFDLLVTPLAYDLELELSPGAGFEVAAVHGAWDWTPGEGKAFIRVPTVFLSKRRGALLVRLTGEATPQAPIVNAFLGWSEGDAAPRDASLGVSYDGEAPLEVDATWYSESGMRKTTVLVNFVLGARKACEAWHAGQQDEARDIALKLTTYLEAQAQALDDDGVRTEATLAAKLAALMQ